MAKYKKTEQDKLIGSNFSKENFIYEWLIEEDMPVSDTRKHRKLSEIEGVRDKTIQQIATWLELHHLSEKKIERIEKKKEILSGYNLENYIKALKPFPTADKVKKGNCAEIILAEYLRYTSGLELLVYRLKYNPNIDQSMKGDDVVLLDRINLNNKIILGEAKYRTTPNKAVVDELLDFFKDERKYPLSLPFIVKILEDKGEDNLAEKLEELIIGLYDLKIPIVNVGFLLSNTNASDVIEKHANSNNESLVFISLGINEGEDLINISYENALKNLQSK